MGKRTVYVVITEERVFCFRSSGLAMKFVRRAKRLPSMVGHSVEYVPTLMRAEVAR